MSQSSARPVSTGYDNFSALEVSRRCAM